MTATTPFTRAPGTPALPATPLRFVAYFLREFRWWYSGMLLFETINSTCGILIPYAMGRIIRAVTGGHAAGPVLRGPLLHPLLLFIGLAVVEVVASRAAGFCQVTVGPRQRHAVTRALYAYLQHHSHRYMHNDFAGALAHRISETSLGVSQTVWAVIFDFWPMAIVFVVATVVLWSAYPGIAVFVGIWAVCFVSLSWVLATRARPFAVTAAAARSDTTGKVVDAVTNLTNTRLFARLGFERSYLDRQLKHELVTIRRSNHYSERVRWFQFTAALILKIGTLFYALLLWSRGVISVAEFVVTATTALLIINEARNLSRRFLDFFEYVGNVTNGVHTIIRPHEIIDLPGAIPAHITRGAIELQHVKFGYEGAATVFDDLSVRIPPGQRVGLVGYSGSGKSTFVSLILRLYEPQQGRVLIDGTDVRQITQESLHSHLGLIPQDPSLFHRSLMENIRYGRQGASDEEVVTAARKAHAHDFIQNVPGGYAALVGERGIKLSGGQRQRVAIARVVLKNAPILILDEATSSLDSVTEKAIQETLSDIMRGRTVLVVAHRLSTIAHLDRILVFDGGRIVEDGSHAQLLAAGGLYETLWTRQAGGFLPDNSDSVAEVADLGGGNGQSRRYSPIIPS
ncbi:MAG TPA: ABC transporter ATP-binding protein [Steroidobacteraceae bacterium]|jgi:ATP-binding cassette subfamily B protein|nr:ABC transporter ATP-binding protein [Steroidobacteraceae bacterium]